MKYLKERVLRFLRARKRRGIQRMFDGYHRKIIMLGNIPTIEDSATKHKWNSKWSVFGARPVQSEYSAYCNYCGENENIVPNDISRNYIETVLTPEEFQPFYNDKNSFGVILPSEMMPTTYFRSVNGILYDGDYNPVRKEDFDALVDNAEKLIVKPSRDMGGHGVSLFSKTAGKEGFYDKEGNKLSADFLLSKYKRNFLVQECMKQSLYMSQFNPTSVNTLRIATYRDVDTGEIRVLGAALRIGGKGAFVDNACSGGSFVKVNDDGSLGKYACNQYGQTSAIYNDINFATSSFVIPEYDRIKEFVKSVAKRLPHMSLFANDVAIDENGNPKLIEVNTTDFSYWFYQLTGQAFFGDQTDSVIEYCLAEQSHLHDSLFQKYM